MARPISDKQRLAYQRNAQHSTGPRTPTGKLNSRLNAVKHGLTAKHPLLPFESETDFAQLRDSFLQDFAPRNTYQQFLVTQLATQAWRILRSQQVEIGLQELLLKQTIHDLEAQGHKTEKVLADSPSPSPPIKTIPTTTSTATSSVTRATSSPASTAPAKPSSKPSTKFRPAPRPPSQKSL